MLSGGSFGFGKSVLSANSRSHTIAVYSVYAPERGDGESARFMGCAFFKKAVRSGSPEESKFRCRPRRAKKGISLPTVAL